MKPADQARRTRVIAVGNQKGGVGKTTNTVHLAAALGEMGRDCLLWDLDMNCGTTRHFGIPAETFLGTFEVLIGEEDPLDVLLTGSDLDGIELPPNVHLLTARRNLEKIDQALAAKNKFLVPQDVLRAPLDRLRGHYDFIFLDTAPNATTLTIAAYVAADYFVLSAMPEMFAVEGLHDALQDIRSAQKHGNPELELLGVILSSVDGRRTRLGEELLGYVERTFAVGNPWSRKFDTTISRAIVVPEAQRAGKTVFQLAPAHRVAEQFRNLARELEARLAALEGEVDPAKEVVHG